MLEQDNNQKKMMLFMRFMRIIAAALCALGLLYLIQQSRLKNTAPQETPPAQTAPQTQSEPVQSPQ